MLALSVIIVMNTMTKVWLDMGCCNICMNTQLHVNTHGIYIKWI